jgi:recombination protein RecA
VRVVKNKVAPPFKVAEFDIMYNEGISKVGDLLDIGVELEIIDKRGSYYSYADSRIAQGRENAKQAIKEDPELAKELEEKIRVAAELVEVEDEEPAESQSDLEGRVDEESLPEVLGE